MREWLVRCVPLAAALLLLPGQGCPAPGNGDCTQCPPGPQGPPGPPGPAGGLEAVYGNGAAGAVTISSNTTLSDPNIQATNFTVNGGVTLTVPSGTTIRCTGTFTNNGTVLVDFGAGGSRQASFEGPLDGAYAPAEAGVSIAPPSPGEFGFTTQTRSGGFGGIGLTTLQARTILVPGVKAGGGSAGRYGANGRLGGGGFTVLAQTAVVNSSGGVINANGSNGEAGVGGSAGGVVILGSPASVTNAGTISVLGGNGGPSSNFAGPGGGGGGGVVHLLAVSVNSGGGRIQVAGGNAGTQGAPNSVTLSPRQGGGGGGACGGSGGAGGGVDALGNPLAAQDGQDGLALTTLADPTALFR